MDSFLYKRLPSLGVKNVFTLFFNSPKCAKVNYKSFSDYDSEIFAQFLILCSYTLQNIASYGDFNNDNRQELGILLRETDFLKDNDFKIVAQNSLSDKKIRCNLKFNGSEYKLKITKGRFIPTKVEGDFPKYAKYAPLLLFNYFTELNKKNSVVVQKFCELAKICAQSALDERLNIHTTGQHTVSIVYHMFFGDSISPPREIFEEKQLKDLINVTQIAEKQEKVNFRNSFMLSTTASIASSMVANIVLSPLNKGFFITPWAYVIAGAYFFYPIISGEYTNFKSVVLRLAIAVSILLLLVSVTGG